MPRPKVKQVEEELELEETEEIKDLGEDDLDSALTEDQEEEAKESLKMDDDDDTEAEEAAEVVEEVPAIKATKVSDRFVELPLTALKVTAKDRGKEDLTDVGDLMASMKTIGQISPIVVEPINGETNKFLVIAGKRRASAAMKLGWLKIKAVVRGYTSEDIQIAEILADNLLHRSPDAMKQAACFKALLDTGKYKTQAALAKATGFSDAFISKRLKMLDLDPAIQKALAAEEISPSDAANIVPKKKKLSTEEMKARIEKLHAFKRVPKEFLQTKQDQNPAPFVVMASKDDIQIKFTLSMKAVRAGAILQQIQSQLGLVGEKECSDNIKKFWNMNYGAK